MMTKTKIFSKRCQKCSTSFQARGPNTKYCPSCQEEIFEERKVKHRQHEIKWEKANKDKIAARTLKFYHKEKEAKPWKQAYRSVLARCNQPTNDSYKNYGALGIQCLLTEQEFAEIYYSTNTCLVCRCDFGEARKDRRTIDRVDPSDHYRIGNVRMICQSCNSKRTQHMRVRMDVIISELENIKKAEVPLRAVESYIERLKDEYSK